MSEATAFSTETIFVRLVGEGVDVWCPVAATSLGGDLFLLDNRPAPAAEECEFGPGESVRVDLRAGDDGLIRVARSAAASDARHAG